MKPALPVTSAAVEASATMETASAMKASTEARLPARGESPGNSSMIKTAEGAGVGTRPGMRCGKSVLRGRTMKIFSMKPTATIESASGSVEVIAINEHSAVG